MGKTKENRILAGVSRRDFIKSAAFAGAGLTGAGLLAGCAPREASDSAKASTGGVSVDDVEWKKEADVVICGFGAAGAAAAIEALEAGSSVTVLEMASEGGGATKMSGGVVYMGGGTRLQKACGVEDSLENMKAYVKAVTNPSGGTERLVDLYCEESVGLCDWLESHGLKFDEAVELEGHTVTAPKGIGLQYTGNERGWEYASIATPAPRGHSPQSTGDLKGGGAMIFDPLKERVEESGADIMYQTEATSLIQDEAGRVIGVRARGDEGEIAIKALKGVVLSAGAFTMNEDMVADYCPEGIGLAQRTACPNDMGTGIKMGVRVGADLHGMGIANIQQFLYLPGRGPASGLLVDKWGLRFIDEAAYGSWVGRAIYHHTPEAAFLVFDSEMREDHAEHLESVAVTFEADSLEDLARQMGVPEKSFVSSVNRYNGFAEAGDDEDYHKDPLFMKPLAVPPFCAIDMNVSTCSFHTLGGLKINEKSQVISIDGSPIDGLYAAGRTACAIFGRYPGSGSSIAEALIFGRIAGKEAAAR